MVFNGERGANANNVAYCTCTTAVEEYTLLDAFCDDALRHSSLLRKHFQRVAVCDDFEAEEQSLSANFCDIGVLAKCRLKSLAQGLAFFGRALDQLFASHDFQHLICRRAGSRMPAVSVEHGRHALFGKRGDDSITRKDTADRRIARGEPFARDHNIGLEIEMFCCKAFSGAPEAHHHFIADDQHAVTRTNFLHHWPIARAGHESPA